MISRVSLFIITLLLCGCSSLFHQPQKSVDLSHLEEYAWMAQLIYRDTSQIKDRFKHYDERYIHEVESVQGRYMVLIDRKSRKQFIVFRGTANWENMVDDARFISRQDEKLEIAIHQGFQEHAEHVFKHLQQHCWNYLDDDYDTFVIGHSLGGATAAIVGAYLVDEGFDVRFVVTFGQPRFTNQAGTEKLKTLPLLRIANHGDAVVDVPIFDGDLSSENSYAHMGLEMMLVDGEDLILTYKGAATAEKPPLLRRILSRININNHMMREYIARLKQRLKESTDPVIEADTKGWFWWKRAEFTWSMP